jgi:protein-disulfide isomerase
MACQAGRAAYAAFMLGGNEAFSAYTELLFRNQNRLKKEPWLEFAEKLNLDKERFKDLIKDGSEADKKIQKDLKLGLDLNLMGTPQLVFEKRKIPAKYRGPGLINLLQDLIRTYHPDQAEIRLRGLI